MPDYVYKLTRGEPLLLAGSTERSSREPNLHIFLLTRQGTSMLDTLDAAYFPHGSRALPPGNSDPQVDALATPQPRSPVHHSARRSS